MFPDSSIAAKVTCGEKKTSYMCVFGLAEHFSRLLKDDVISCFSVLFDESLNKKTQKQQMDIHPLFFHYFGSEFLGKLNWYWFYILLLICFEGPGIEMYWSLWHEKAVDLHNSSVNCQMIIVLKERKIYNVNRRILWLRLCATQHSQ